MTLTAVDNKAGIKDLMYSVDGENFKQYQQPFYLPKTPGYHVVEFYANDSTDNTTKKSDSHKYNKYQYSTEKIYVDLNGPTIGYDYIGDLITMRDTVYINKDTKIRLKATDKEAGLNYTSYSPDGQQEEIQYDKPFTIPKDGTHNIEYFAYDKVNNRNIGKFYFVTDNLPPIPKYEFSNEPIGRKDGINIYPDYIVIYLAATDKRVGTENIYYSLNGAPEIVCGRYISGFKKESLNTLKIRVIDRLKNEKIIELQFYIQ